MADIISKASDTEIKVTTEKTISLRLLKQQKANLDRQLATITKSLENINAQIDEAIALGIKE